MPDAFPPWPPPGEAPRSNEPPLLTDAEDALAPWGPRFVAAFIDNWLFLVPSLLVMLALVPFEGWNNPEGVLQRSSGGQAVRLALFVPVPVAQWTLISTTGQSIGKRLFGLRILRTDGRLPGFLHGVVLRNWVVLVPGSLCGILALVDVAFVLSPSRRAIHDYLAGTVVVPAGFGTTTRRSPGPAEPVVESGPWTAPTQE